MDTFWPTIAFINVDLPAFGAPIRVTKPARWPVVVDFIMVLSISYHYAQSRKGIDGQLLFLPVCDFCPHPCIALRPLY